MAAYGQSFGYDNLGRLSSGLLGSYSYGDAAHLHAPTAIGTGYTAAYDAAGNMTCRATDSSSTWPAPAPPGGLSYDAEATLSGWQDSSSGTSDAFLYDNQGERVEQQVSASSGATTTIYVDNLEEITSSPSGTSTSAFYYAGSVRVAVSVNGSLSYLAQDALGSTNLALDGSGSATAAVLNAP